MVKLQLSFRYSELVVTNITISIQTGLAVAMFLFCTRTIRQTLLHWV